MKTEYYHSSRPDAGILLLLRRLLWLSFCTSALFNIKATIGASAWQTLEDYAVKIKGGNKAVTQMMENNFAYASKAAACEEIACDFIGELMSNKKTLNTFCASIKSGNINAAHAKGISASFQRILNRLTAKSKQYGATAALVKCVQEMYGTDIETAQAAAKDIQAAAEETLEKKRKDNALMKQAAEEAQSVKQSVKSTPAAEENENAAKNGDVKYLKKDTKASATSPLSGSPAIGGEAGMTLKPLTAAAENLGTMKAYYKKANLSRVQPC